MRKVSLLAICLIFIILASVRGVLAEETLSSTEEITTSQMTDGKVTTAATDTTRKQRPRKRKEKIKKKENTIIKKKVKKHYCTRSGCTEYEIDTVDKTEHVKETKNQKAATCTEKGYSGDIYCKNCETLLEEGKEIAAAGHQHTELKNVKAATCENAGYTGDIYCKDCEQIIKAGTETKATGHTWDEGKVTKEATCEEAGEKTYTCKNCNVTKTEEIKATGHIHTEIRDQKAATCKATGYTGDTYCTDCKKLISKGKEIAKRSHDWKIEEKKATCEKTGERTSTCKSCGEIKTETLSATGHKYGAWKTISTVTVFAPAKQTRRCSVCGKSETRTYGSKLRATIKMNATSLKLKRKQSTTKFKVIGLAKGDYVRSWTTSNKKIATVTGSKNGTCKIKAGSKTGTAKITITLASGLRKTISVKVQKGTVTCTFIKGIPKKVTIKRRKSYQLRAAVNPFTCTTKVKYKSSNSKIAKVTSKGKITAGKKKGKAKITISVGKKKFVCTVTVK